MKYSALWVALQVLVVVAAPNPALSGKTRTSGVIGGSRLADLVGGTRANRDVASNNNADTTGEVSHAIGDQLGENEGGHVRGRFGRLGGIGAGRQTGGGGGLFRGFGSAGSNTFNEALPGNPCKPVTVVFARGTTEGGNVGSILGPPLFDALEEAGLDIARQGVNDYPADIAGFLAGGSDSGATNMAGIVDDVAFRCPDTRIVMIGYSQGAQVARKAASQVTATQNVNSVILFGDPLAGSNVVMFSGQNKALTICNNGDLICEGRPTVRAPHLDYARRVEEAVQFVQLQ